MLGLIPMSNSVSLSLSLFSIKTYNFSTQQLSDYIFTVHRIIYMFFPCCISENVHFEHHLRITCINICLNCA